jgi:hypothetical protein
MSLGLASALSVEGCGSSSPSTSGDGGGGTTGPTGTTGGGDGGGGTGTGTVPPTQPSGASATSSTTPQNFALHHIHLGDELDSSGSPNWYQYGYNLDGKITTATSTDVCTLAPNTNKKNQTDGTNGIDNSFGENIIPLLEAVTSNPSATIDNSLALGHFTIMMNITGLSGAAGQSATGLTGGLFGGVNFDQGPNEGGGAPTFTTADNWPLDPSYVSALGPPVVSNVTFNGAYIADGTFVSGGYTSLNLSLTISGVTIVIPVQHAIITFNTPGASDAGTSPTHASGGIIAGIIDEATMVSKLGPVAASLGACSALPTLDNGIAQAADIMDDGTNNAGVACNGISIGLGFDADQIGQPAVEGMPASGSASCSDAGATDN